MQDAIPTVTPVPSNLSPTRIPINYEDDENDLLEMESYKKDNTDDDKDYFTRRDREYDKSYEEAVELIKKKLSHVSDALGMRFTKPTDSDPQKTILETENFVVMKKDGSVNVCFCVCFDSHEYLKARACDREWYVNISKESRSLVFAAEDIKFDQEEGVIIIPATIDLMAVRCPVAPSKKDIENHTAGMLDKIKRSIGSATAEKKPERTIMEMFIKGKNGNSTTKTEISTQKNTAAKKEEMKKKEVASVSKKRKIVLGPTSPPKKQKTSEKPTETPDKKELPVKKIDKKELPRPKTDASKEKSNNTAKGTKEDNTKSKENINKSTDNDVKTNQVGAKNVEDCVKNSKGNKDDEMVKLLGFFESWFVHIITKDQTGDWLKHEVYEGLKEALDEYLKFSLIAIAGSKTGNKYFVPKGTFHETLAPSWILFLNEYLIKRTKIDRSLALHLQECKTMPKCNIYESLGPEFKGKEFYCAFTGEKLAIRAKYTLYLQVGRTTMYFQRDNYASFKALWYLSHAFGSILSEGFEKDVKEAKKECQKKTEDVYTFYLVSDSATREEGSKPNSDKSKMEAFSDAFMDKLEKTIKVLGALVNMDESTNPIQ